MLNLTKALYHLSAKARTNWYGGHYALAQFLAPPSNAPLPQPGSMPGWEVILADLNALNERDWTQIERGEYRPPADMVPNPLALARQSLRYLRDLPAINQRRRLGLAKELKPDVAGQGYPDYFLQNFHFQTDGWLSEDSAEIYDFQVEVLFVGGADVMRRQTLPAIRRALSGQSGMGMRLCDIACGTGRYLREVQRNWPGLALTGIDLSADYITHANRQQGRQGKTQFLTGMAEDLPLEDESQDLITCIYLFHELPADIRRLAAAEMIRVLKPGGQLVFMDSIQIGDHQPYDALLDRFPIAFHEPYYADYIRDDIDGLFKKAGFEKLTRERAFFSTGWVFRKPC
ncbi:class I SAM-dependent methyltransferase [Aestuariispira insulae]|uniref:Ubiquinone/menaquinone biosynthesis C-methylase UbiE n=1 Tax=Aestuariispira insulae TaxID=1461337 RepID=A0A3D9H9K7_9PROT|nr:class I SAM-dependent methyltransferase [Aestuariispira insulae]RED46159.1 ubiquinone/menaquinone biosynthesis C-methylase UbiE [Aestuariispira insulae]